MAKIRFLRLPEVISRVGFKRTKIYELIGEGEFPEGIHLSGCRIRVWLESDVENWMKEQVEQAAA